MVLFLVKLQHLHHPELTPPFSIVTIFWLYGVWMILAIPLSLSSIMRFFLYFDTSNATRVAGGLLYVAAMSMQIFGDFSTSP